MAKLENESYRNSLRDVCELLMTEGLIDDDQQQSFQNSSVSQWFHSLFKSYKQYNNEDPLNVDMEQTDTRKVNIYSKIVPRLLQVLRECILTQRYQSALSVLQGLSAEPHNTAITLWKVSMELMYQHPHSNCTLIEEQVRNLKRLSEYDGKEVVLEFVMYLLHQGNLQEAKTKFQEISKMAVKRTKMSEKARYGELLFAAYQGLIWHAEWMTAKTRLERTETEMDDGFQQGGEICLNYEDIMRNYAQKAFSCFSELYSHLGEWDIFITKHVQMLEYYNSTQEALQILELYQDKNPENPNSLKYVYQFLVRQKEDHQKILRQLKRVVNCCPSDSLALTLCDQLLQDDMPSEALPYIFGLQDFSCWQNEEKSWAMLANLLSICVKKDRQIVKKCWELRKSWWPGYHFVFTGCEECSPLVWLYRASCSILLQVISEKFVTDVQEVLDERQRQNLNEVWSCVDNT